MWNVPGTGLWQVAAHWSTTCKICMAASTETKCFLTTNYKLHHHSIFQIASSYYFLFVSFFSFSFFFFCIKVKDGCLHGVLPWTQFWTVPVGWVLSRYNALYKAVCSVWLCDGCRSEDRSERAHQPSYASRVRSMSEDTQSLDRYVFILHRKMWEGSRDGVGWGGGVVVLYM